jgi:hypothetical protein
MALSVLTHPEEVMNALAREFEIVDEEDVLAFLARHPTTPSLLGEIREAIRRFFGHDQVKLGVFRDPEWPDDDPELFVYVQSHRDAREALAHLKRFDRDWWLAKRAESSVPVVVTMHLI